MAQNYHKLHLKVSELKVWVKPVNVFENVNTVPATRKPIISISSGDFLFHALNVSLLLAAVQLCNVLVLRSYDMKYFNFGNVSVLCKTNRSSFCLIIKFSHAVDGLFSGLGYSRKKTNRGGWGYTFLKLLLLEILPLEILQKTSFYPLKFCKIVWHPLAIPRSKTKTHGNSKWVFLEYPWKFHFFFNWLLDFPHALCFSTSGNSMPSPSFPPHVRFFSGIAHYYLGRRHGGRKHKRAFC